MSYRVLRNIGADLAQKHGLPLYEEGQAVDGKHGELLASLNLAAKVVKAVPDAPTIKADSSKPVSRPEVKTPDSLLRRVVQQKPTPDKEQ